MKNLKVCNSKWQDKVDKSEIEQNCKAKANFLCGPKSVAIKMLSQAKKNTQMPNNQTGSQPDFRNQAGDLCLEKWV